MNDAKKEVDADEQASDQFHFTNKNLTGIAGRLLKKRKSKDKKPPTIDMLSFASTMTIILAFFIMLTSFAGRPEDNAVQDAVQSFKEALENYGLSKIVYGRTNSVANLNYVSKRKGVKSDSEIVIGRTFSNLIDREIEIEYIRKGRQLYFPTNIGFIDGGTELTPSSKAYLNNLIKLIKERDCQVTVSSYTDENFVPSDEYTTSWQFTAERSAAVTNYLHKTGNIGYKSMTAIGYGEYQPLLGEEAFFDDDANNRTNIIISSDGR
jgi:chemotaxis protein MotB